MIVIVNHNANVASIAYEANIAYGIILMFISTIVLVCVPNVKGSKKNTGFIPDASYVSGTEI